MVANFKDLIVYKKAFDHAMKIFHVTKTFPKVEQYSLTDQIRRSSRSICANIGEAWRKRRYPAHFVSKLTDSDAETSETMIWLDFALECGYVDLQVHKELAVGIRASWQNVRIHDFHAGKLCYSEKK